MTDEAGSRECGECRHSEPQGMPKRKLWCRAIDYLRLPAEFARSQHHICGPEGRLYVSDRRSGSGGDGHPMRRSVDEGVREE